MTAVIGLGLIRTAIPKGVAVLASGRHDFLVQGIHAPAESTVVRNVVPDPLVPLVQFIFQQPGWVLGLEMLVGALAAAAVVYVLWVRRIWMFGWFRSAPRGAQLMFVGANLGIVLVAAGTAGYGYHYMMHDNDFCKGCHIFVPSGQPWVRPDTGNYLLVNALEGKHDTLTCHSCHPFQITAQTKEMFFWIADRPQQVPPHGRVPQQVCERCHVQGEGKERWQQIAQTAGHRIHLAEDSTKAGGKIQCLTCHARSAHRFEARDSTCMMKGCHVGNTIRLGRMAANQTSFHCTLCHAFAATPTIATPQDSLRTLLIPGGQQCLACHGMKQLTAAFDFSKDPHQARCGSCHDPHGQERPRDADSTCASCHTKWRDIPFHTGAIHRNHVRPSACTACHQPHAARVDASDCTGCHSAMREREDGVEERRPPPMSFDTAATLRTSAMTPAAPTPPPGRGGAEVPRPDTVTPPPPREPRGKGDAPVADDEPPPWRADSFPHARHQRLACITCHDPRSNRKLTFEPGRGCQICHHQSPEQNNCATCHRPDSLAAPISVTLSVAAARRPARARPVGFPHARHTSVRCVECHATPTTLAPSPAAASCTACHEKHAAATVDCAACHQAIPDSAHAPPVDAHRACASCHEVATVATLTPTRNLCLTCHAPQRDHKPGLECTTCHLQATPEQYRPALARARETR